MIVCGCDLAFSRNSSAIAIARPGDVFRVREWQPMGEPLKPSVVVAEAVAEMKRHRVEVCSADGWYVRVLEEALDAAGIAFVAAPKVPYDAVKVMQEAIAEGRIRIVHEERLRLQLEAVKLTYESGGHTKVHLDTASDGSHGDIAAATFLAAWLLDEAKDTGRMESGALDRGAAWLR